MKNIFCLETDWDMTSNKMKDHLSVLPLLHFMEQKNSIISKKISCIHRHVATESDLYFYIDQLKKKSLYGDYGIVYLAFHGDRGEIALPNKQRVGLEEMANRCVGAFHGKYVHFGACRTLLASTGAIELFKEKTGATVVSGYTRSVDFSRSSILDIAYMSEIIRSRYHGPIQNRLNKYYGGLMAELGFKMV